MNVAISKRTWTDKATEDDIYYCFRLILWRPPNAEEISGHFAFSGESLTDVVKSYIRSNEFASRKLLVEAVPDDIELTKLDGFSIYTSAKDLAVGRHVRGGAYEPEVTAIFGRFLRPGMTVLDVGANIGFFTMLSASIVGPSGHVLAVEPNVNNVRLLEGSRRANGFHHVTVANTAAGKELGLLALNTSHSNGTTSAVDEDMGALMAAWVVPCFPLSAMVPAGRRVDFIKLDVEGAEYLALQGAKDLLQRDRPVIVSEFSPPQMQGVSGVQAAEYLRFIESFGYRLSVIQKAGDPFECDVDGVMNAFSAAESDHIDFLAVPTKGSRLSRLWRRLS
jgi:FkbM family methyltransferase